MEQNGLLPCIENRSCGHRTKRRELSVIFGFLTSGMIDRTVMSGLQIFSSLKFFHIARMTDT